MKFLIVLSSMVAAILAAPQLVNQQAAAPSPASTFFFTPFSGVPPVFSLGQSSIPLLPQSAALQIAPSTPAPAQSAALLQANDVSLNSINGQPAAGQILPAELARAYTESNLRLAQAYKDAEIRLAAANQKAASEALAQAIAGASAAANAGSAQNAASQNVASVQSGASVAGSAPAGVVAPSVIPLGFPISLIPGLSSSIAGRANGRR